MNLQGSKKRYKIMTTPCAVGIDCSDDNCITCGYAMECQSLGHALLQSWVCKLVNMLKIINKNEEFYPFWCLKVGVEVSSLFYASIISFNKYKVIDKRLCGQNEEKKRYTYVQIFYGFQKRLHSFNSGCKTLRIFEGVKALLP